MSYKNPTLSKSLSKSESEGYNPMNNTEENKKIRKKKSTCNNEVPPASISKVHMVNPPDKHTV